MRYIFYYVRPVRLLFNAGVGLPARALLSLRSEKQLKVNSQRTDRK